MKKIIYLTLALSFIIISSCAKKIQDVNPDYFGYWESIESNESKTFNINSGISVYTTYDDAKTVSYTGRARVKENEKKLKIGINGFTIDAPPYQDSYGTFFMEIEGSTFERY